MINKLSSQTIMIVNRKYLLLSLLLLILALILNLTVKAQQKVDSTARSLDEVVLTAQRSKQKKLAVPFSVVPFLKIIYLIIMPALHLKHWQV